MRKKEEINREIDRLLWKARFKEIYPYLKVSLLFVGIFGLMGLYYLPGEQKELTGIVRDLKGVAKEDGRGLFMTVSLEEDTLVDVPIPDSGYYKKDKLVVLQKYKSEYFGTIRYQFLKYEAGEKAEAFGR